MAAYHNRACRWHLFEGTDNDTIQPLAIGGDGGSHETFGCAAANSTVIWATSPSVRLLLSFDFLGEVRQLGQDVAQCHGINGGWRRRDGYRRGWDRRLN